MHAGNLNKSWNFSKNIKKKSMQLKRKPNPSFFTHINNTFNPIRSKKKIRMISNFKKKQKSISLIKLKSRGSFLRSLSKSKKNQFSILDIKKANQNKKTQLKKQLTKFISRSMFYKEDEKENLDKSIKDKVTTKKNKAKKNNFNFNSLAVSSVQKKSLLKPVNFFQNQFKENKRYPKKIHKKVIIQNFIDRQIWNKEFIWKKKNGGYNLSKFELMNQFEKPQNNIFFKTKILRKKTENQDENLFSISKKKIQELNLSKDIRFDPHFYFKKNFVFIKSLESLFKKVDVIGKGSFSIVYKVKSTKSGVFYANKCLKTTDFINKKQINNLTVYILLSLYSLRYEKYNINSILFFGIKKFIF